MKDINEVLSAFEQNKGQEPKPIKSTETQVSLGTDFISLEKFCEQIEKGDFYVKEKKEEPEDEE